MNAIAALPLCASSLALILNSALIVQLASFLNADVPAWAPLLWAAAARTQSQQLTTDFASSLQPCVVPDPNPGTECSAEQSASDDDASRAARVQAQRAQLAPLLPRALQPLQAESPDLAQELLPSHPLLIANAPLPLKLLLPDSVHAAACRSVFELHDGQLGLCVDVGDSAVTDAVARVLPQLTELACVTLHGSIRAAVDVRGPVGRPLHRIVGALAAMPALRALSLCVHRHNAEGVWIPDNCGTLMPMRAVAVLFGLTHLRLAGQLVDSGTPFGDRSYTTSELLELTTLTNLRSLVLGDVSMPSLGPGSEHSYPEAAVMPLSQLLAALPALTWLEMDAAPDEEYSLPNRSAELRCDALRTLIMRIAVCYLPSPCDWAPSVIAQRQLTRLELPLFRTGADEANDACAAMHFCTQLRNLTLAWEHPTEAMDMINMMIVDLVLLTALQLTVQPLHERMRYGDGDEWSEAALAQLKQFDVAIEALYTDLKATIDALPDLTRLTANYAGACSATDWVWLLQEAPVTQLDYLKLGGGADNTDTDADARVTFSIRLLEKTPGDLWMACWKRRVGYSLAPALCAVEDLDLTFTQLYPELAPTLMAYIAAHRLSRLRRLRFEFVSYSRRVCARARRMLTSLVALTRLELFSPAAGAILPCTQPLPTLRALHVAPASVPAHPSFSNTPRACAAPRAPELGYAATALHSLRLERTSVRYKEAYARSIGSMVTLTELHLSNVFAAGGGDALMRALGPQLAGLCALQLLTLRSLRFTHASAEPLASGLCDRTRLSVLDLSGNRVGDQGARVLAGALSTLASLSELRLGGWTAGPGGAAALAPALAVLPCLRRLVMPHRVTASALRLLCPELVCVSTRVPVVTLHAFYQSV